MLGQGRRLWPKTTTLFGSNIVFDGWSVTCDDYDCCGSYVDSDRCRVFVFHGTVVFGVFTNGNLVEKN